MLAYVFWHWPQAHVDRKLYRTHLVEFHKTLASNKPRGFHHSAVFQISKAPWLDTDGIAFEDWYLLDDSAALDPLNDGAVSGACEEPHNRIAREAADGTAGLYRWRYGKMSLTDARNAMWFSKPAGLSYRDLYDSMQPLVDEYGAALWCRQMTLGPGTEFCLLSRTSVKLSEVLNGRQIDLEVVWPVTDLTTQRAPPIKPRAIANSSRASLIAKPTTQPANQKRER